MLKMTTISPPSQNNAEFHILSNRSEKQVKFKAPHGRQVCLTREVYLRPDVDCHSLACHSPTCIGLASEGRYLPADTSTLFVIDGNYALQCWDLFELTSIRGLIVSLSTMYFVQQQATSLRPYKRICRCLADPAQTSVLFDNEFHQACFRPKSPSDDLINYTTKMNVIVAQWYQSHLKASGVTSVVLLTDNKSTAVQHVSQSLPESPEVDNAIIILNLHEFLATYHPNLTEAKLLLDSLEASIKSTVETDLPTSEIDANGPTTNKKAIAGDGQHPYVEYLPESALMAGIRSGQFLRGTLRVNRFRPRSQAVVTLTDASALKHQPELKDALARRSEVTINNLPHRNRAIDGDAVVIRLLPRSAWTKSSGDVSQEESSVAQLSVDVTLNSEEASSADPVPDSTTSDDSSGAVVCGYVVGIAARRWRDYVCTFVPMTTTEGESVSETGWVLVTPWDRRIPRIRLHTTQASRLTRERFVVRIDSWLHTSSYPQGHLVQMLGPIGELETETQILLIEHNLAIRAFTDAQLAELAPYSRQRPWRVDPSEVGKRRDFRNPQLSGNPKAEDLLVFSIDPPDCQDVDDALSVRWLPSSKDQPPLLELGVHIADVTFFVPPNSYVDAEAKRRSTSVYLADRRYDMLPGLLSGDLCSLWSGVDRYAVSVVWHINPETLEVVSVWYGRSIIHSAYKLSYEVAQNIYNLYIGVVGVSGSDPGELKPSTQSASSTTGRTLLDRLGGLPEACKGVTEFKQLSEDQAIIKLGRLGSTLHLLVHLASSIRSRRAAEGGLELDSLEVCVQFANPTDRSGPVERLAVKQPLEMHATIAELMIFANHWVARRCLDSHPDRACLRRHPPPRPEHFDELKLVAQSKGLTVNIESNKALASSLAQLSASSDPEVRKVLVQLVTRAMTNALYFCTGTDSLTRDQFAHYGLALNLYTHFTSPIRRYADVVVHRVLLAALGDCRTAVDDNSTATNTDQLWLLTPEDLGDLCKHMNEQHWAAQQVQRASLELFQSLYFKRLASESSAGQVTADAIICQLRGDNGFVVLASHYGIRGAVCLRDKQGRIAWADKSNNKISWINPSDGGRSLEVKRATPSISNNDQPASGWLEVRDLTTNQSQAYHVFDHVKVAIGVSESVAHGLSLRLELLGGPVTPSADAPPSDPVDYQKRSELIQTVRDQDTAKRSRRLMADITDSTLADDEQPVTGAEDVSASQDRLIADLHNASSSYHLFLSHLRQSS